MFTQKTLFIEILKPQISFITIKVKLKFAILDWEENLILRDR